MDCLGNVHRYANRVGLSTLPRTFFSHGKARLPQLFATGARSVFSMKHQIEKSIFPMIGPCKSAAQQNGFGVAPVGFYGHFEYLHIGRYDQDRRNYE